MEVEMGKETSSIGIKLLDDSLASLSDIVDPEVHRVIYETHFGKVPLWAFVPKVQLPDIENSDNMDEGMGFLDSLNAEPFISVRLRYGRIESYVGYDDDESMNSHVFEIKKGFMNLARIFGRENAMEKPRVVWYDPNRKHLSMVGALVALKIAVKDDTRIDDAMRTVLFETINSQVGLGVTEVELAGVDDVVERCMRILNTSDDRLASRHILLAGPPGCGKSEITKELVRRTPEWIHYPMGNDYFNLDGRKFVSSANKLMKFIGRRIMVIVDEVDEIGTMRDADRFNHSTYELLRMLDGVSESTNVRFVGTTNRPGSLDPALKRVGRFGPVIILDKPDAKVAHQIVNFYADRYGASVDIKHIVDNLNGAVGCDIRAAFENCVIHERPITTENVLSQLNDVLDAKKIEMQNFA